MVRKQVNEPGRERPEKEPQEERRDLRREVDDDERVMIRGDVRPEVRK